MKTVFAERFKSARLMNGFSLQDLADALDNKLSRQALHRYEKEKLFPMLKNQHVEQSPRSKPRLLFRTTKVELSDIEYRKLSKMPQKMLPSSMKTKEYLSRYLELEEILGLSNDFEHPLKDFPIVTEYKQVNEAANLLRKRWELGKGPIFNIVELLEDKNIKVVKLDVAEDFDGLQTFVNGNIPVVAYNARKANKPDRIRFTLLHELAHLLLKFGDISEKEKETLCHQFSGAMLLPEETIKGELGAHRSKLSILELGNIKNNMVFQCRLSLCEQELAASLMTTIRNNSFSL